MKNRIFLGLLAVLALAGPAFADSAPRVLTMSGQGEVKGAPDTVTLSAGVRVQAASAAAALAANTPKMQAVMAALRRQGIADRNIQTSQFTVSPQYANAPGETPRLTGYQVTNEVSVRLEDVAKLGAVLDALVAAGANQINRVNFSIADSSLLLTQARQRAVADALAKAQTFAKAAGVTLGPILSISEGGLSAPRPYGMEEVMVTGARVAIAPGEETINATVSIVWQIQ